MVPRVGLWQTGEVYARALGTLGAWCTGVTSRNPNVRVDMYRQLIARIRGARLESEAAHTVLFNSVHGVWLQLVEDFAIRKEVYSPEDDNL
jgi:hypothetical protein